MISRAPGSRPSRGSSHGKDKKSPELHRPAEESSRWVDVGNESPRDASGDSSERVSDSATEIVDGDSEETKVSGKSEAPDPEYVDSEPSSASSSADSNATADSTASVEQSEGAAFSEEDELPQLEGDRLRACIEAILFASPEPVSRRRLYRLLPETDNAKIRNALLELEGELLSTPRGYFLSEEASGFRFLTKSEFAPHVARLRGEKRRIRLSAAAFESLAVIAYRQPVRRSDLEAIRGVQSGAILKNLMEWSLIRVLGHDNSPGRPLLYGTTTDFLELLGLGSLEDLPEPERLRERGADQGLEVLDRIIEEGGGVPVVAGGTEDGLSGSSRGETDSSSQTLEDEESLSTEFDLDLGDEEE